VQEFENMDGVFVERKERLANATTNVPAPGSQDMDRV